MALSVFEDKSTPPTEDALHAALGATTPWWLELIARIEARFSPVDETWGFSGKSTGWGLRLKRGERTILYMTPRDGHFLVSFALGDKAVKTAHERALPAGVLSTIDRAPKYAEGRGVRFEIRAGEDLAAMETLAEIKMAT